MRWYALPRRIIGLSIVATLILGQPGSVCAVHCLFDCAHGHGDDQVVLAAGSSGSDAAPGDHTELCRPDHARVQDRTVDVAPVGAMAACQPAVLTLAPTALQATVASTPTAPPDIFAPAHRPPPRV